jgi:deoxycytidine triphosphate deaminase
MGVLPDWMIKRLGICVGKSTYVRCGIIVNVTPLEP